MAGVSKDSLEVRPARPADEPAIQHLLTHTPFPFVHAWPWADHLGQDLFLVTLLDGNLVGALLAWPDAGPVAWVRLGVLASGIGTGPWLDRNIPPLLPPLRRRGGRVLAWMDAGGWVGPALKTRGFQRSTRLVTLMKENQWLPDLEAEPVTLRPAQERDIPTLVPVDHAAFSPPWWLSGATLERIRREALCFLVAEKGGGYVGYAEAQRTPHGAHIGRLAVVPLVQGQGIGRRLLAALLSCLWEQGIERVTLNTQERNRPSRRLYARFGFRPVGRRVEAWERAL